MKYWLQIIVILLSFTLFSEDYYIYENANGAGNGRNWLDAYNQLPVELVRGATYYIAPGNYGVYKFDDTESGSEWIKIVRATKSNHGTDTGWFMVDNSSQVYFSSIAFYNSYYEIDGVTGGGPGNWVHDYGIKLVFEEGNPWPFDTKMVTFHGTPQPTNIHLKHIDFEHIGIDWGPTGDIIYAGGVPDGESGPSEIYIGYCYLHDCSRNQILTSRANNWIFEYNKIARNKSTVRHAEGWQDFGSNNITIRYNNWEDIQGSCYIALKKNSGGALVDVPLHNYNWKIYGNIMYHTHNYDDGSNENIIGGQGVIGAVGPNSDAIHSNIHIYNNTIYNIYGFNCGFYFSTGMPSEIYAYNNLFINNNAKSSNIGLTEMDYNFYVNHTFSWTTTSNDNDIVTEIDPTNNSYIYDFDLSKAAGKGKYLSDEYSFDMYGTQRGKDGTWDIGAIEFNPFNDNLAPINLRIKNN